jgi:tetratricopeptide (TPR) repeat protein
VKRLLVNGRFEASNHSAKSPGVLAHLPLLIHPEPRRALVVGSSTGDALFAAASHDLNRIDVFETGRVAARATATFGPVATALLDPRLRVHLGDFEDLLARADDYDVILLQPSGRWTLQAARACTKEALALIRARLGDGGIACQWVPDSALSRDGFLVLLATWAHVFPHVEVWAGQGGDVIVLGKRDAAPHNFERVLEGYRTPRVADACARAWIGSPETLLSQFLIGDGSVRRLAAGRAVHSRSNGELTRREADRRREFQTVDPVSGLVGIRDDVVATLRNAPAEGFAAAMAQALRARDLERTGLEFELRGEVDEATRSYLDAIAANPHDGAARRAYASLRSELGVGFANRQSFLIAHKYMREAVETDSTYAIGFGNLGLLLMQTESYDYAIACNDQALALAPDDDLFLIQLGRTWRGRGYLDKALPCFEEAMRLNPLNVEAAIGYVDTKLAMEGDSPDVQRGIDLLMSYRAVDPAHQDLLYRIRKLEDLQAKRNANLGGSATPGP